MQTLVAPLPISAYEIWTNAANSNLQDVVKDCGLAMSLDHKS